jgi:hypothetical protein
MTEPLGATAVDRERKIQRVSKPEDEPVITFLTFLCALSPFAAAF